MKSSFQNLEILELYSGEVISQRVKELAKRIANDYLPLLEKEGAHFKLVLVGILSGAEPFLSDLSREMSVFFPAGYIEKEYVAISSYKDETTSKEMQLLLDTKRPIKNSHVVITEDIIDTGKTLNQLKFLLAVRSPLTLKICTFINKTPRREKDIQLDYVGFEVKENLWLVGFGLDYQGRYRELPYIGYLARSENRKDLA